MNRAQMLNAVEGILEAVKESKTKGSAPLVFVPKKKELSDEQKAEDEYEALGYFISHNPLEKYKIKLNSLVKTLDLEHEEVGKVVSMGGLITELKEITTKAGRSMAFFMLEDLTGRVEVVVFSSVYNKWKHIIEKNKPVHVIGKLEVQSREINGEEVKSFKLLALKLGELEEGKELKKITLTVQENDDFPKIHDIIMNNPGETRVVVEYKNAVLDTPYKITQDTVVLSELESNCLMRREYGKKL